MTSDVFRNRNRNPNPFIPAREEIQRRLARGHLRHPLIEKELGERVLR